MRSAWLASVAVLALAGLGLAACGERAASGASNAAADNILAVPAANKTDPAIDQAGEQNNAQENNAQGRRERDRNNGSGTGGPRG